MSEETNVKDGDKLSLSCVKEGGTLPPPFGLNRRLFPKPTRHEAVRMLW